MTFDLELKLKPLVEFPHETERIVTESARHALKRGLTRARGFYCSFERKGGA